MEPEQGFLLTGQGFLGLNVEPMARKQSKCCLDAVPICGTKGEGRGRKEVVFESFRIKHPKWSLSL